MMETGVIPACAADLKSFEGTALGGKRGNVYKELEEAVDSLQQAFNNLPDSSPAEQARYCVENIKPTG